MLKLFKKEAVKVIERTFTKQKSVNEMIEEIHQSFDTEVEKLLAEANVSHSLETDKQHLIDKCARLKSLGFINTKEVKQAEGELSRLEALKVENAKKSELIAAINHFQQKYPHYKFITEDSVKKICAKYGLIYGSIGQYIGAVPDSNLRTMEAFKIDEKDECRFSAVYYRGWQSETLDKMQYYNVEPAKESPKPAIDKDEYMRNLMWASIAQSNSTVERKGKCGLEIAAPLSDFNTQGMELKKFELKDKIEIPDPVVLQPVHFAGQKHYLIVTAWGLEASDELVVNEKHN